jgi:hypothetical protein
MLLLDRTDRLRVAVRVAQGREIPGVEDILNGGPIGTGPLPRAWRMCSSIPRCDSGS